MGREHNVVDVAAGLGRKGEIRGIQRDIERPAQARLVHVNSTCMSSTLVRNSGAQDL